MVSNSTVAYHLTIPWARLEKVRHKLGEINNLGSPWKRVRRWPTLLLATFDCSPAALFTSDSKPRTPTLPAGAVQQWFWHLVEPRAKKAQSNQVTLLRHVTTGATLLDVAHVALSATGKYKRFPGCPIHTANREVQAVPCRWQARFGGQ